MNLRKLFQFRLRAVLILLTLICMSLWWFVTRPRERQQRQVSSGQSQIHSRDRLYAESCYDDVVGAHLVTVLGDSRMSHWGRVRWLHCPDKDTVVSYGADQALLKWNFHDGSIRQGFYDVPFAALAGTAGSVALSDASGQVRLWSLATAEIRDIPVRVPKTRTPWAAITPDAAYFLHAEFAKPITVWRCETGEQIGTIASDWDWHCTAVSPKNTLALANHEVVKEYDVATGELLASLSLPAFDHGGFASAGDLVFSPDGNTLYLGDAEGRLCVFDWSERKLVETRLVVPDSIFALAVSASGDGIYVGSQSHCIRLSLHESEKFRAHAVFHEKVSAATAGLRTAFGLQKGRIVVRSGDRELRMEGGPRVDATCFAYSPTGDRIALAGRDGQIVIRTTDRWEQINSWKADLGWIHYIIWTPDGEYLATLGDDNKLAIWETRTGQESRTVAASSVFSARRAAYSRDGSRLAIPSRTRDALITVYDTQDFSIATTIPTDAIELRGDVTFSNDGRILYIGGSQAKVYAWDLTTGASVASMGRRSNSEVKLALSPSGDTVYAAIMRDIEAFDTTTSLSRWLLKTSTRRVFDISQHPSRPILAAGTSDGTVILIDALTGTMLQTLRLGPSGGEIWQVDFSPDGSLLTAAMSNGSVVVMRTPSMK